VSAGCAILVGTDRVRIAAEAARFLNTGAVHRHPAVGNPFGDGHGAVRAAAAIARLLGLTTETPQPFRPEAARRTLVAEGAGK
jgi:UDP-N-acetylglucosamine 2-epimerase (non-hydrolysing)